MKANWKVLVALVLMVGASTWAADSIRSTSYSGANLNFSVGTGTVTMTNPSSEAIPVRLTGTSNRSFSLSSTIEGVPRSSTREGTASFDLPPGVSEFTIVRGSDVNFIADTNTHLEAAVHTANSGTKVKVLVVCVLGALFSMSYTAEHRWICKLLGKEPARKLHSMPDIGEQDVDMRPTM